VGFRNIKFKDNPHCDDSDDYEEEDCDINVTSFAGSYCAASK